MNITLNIKLEYPNFKLELNQSLDIEGITGLTGPSGCGKTSLLRMIAGLEKQGKGSIILQGQTLQDSSRNMWLAAHERPIGFVFQDARLFTHMNVYENLSYPLKRRHCPISLDDVCDSLDLGKLLKRSTTNLSGGEKQRVAIGRAILTNPSILLMDEPLSALDQEAREEIYPYLEELVKNLKLPILYVSHDQGELSKLCRSGIIKLSPDSFTHSQNTSTHLKGEVIELSNDDYATCVFDDGRKGSVKLPGLKPGDKIRITYESKQ